MSAIKEIKKQRNQSEKEIERVNQKIDRMHQEIEQLRELVRKEKYKVVQFDTILNHIEWLFDEEGELR